MAEMARHTVEVENQFRHQPTLASPLLASRDVGGNKDCMSDA
ncbi:hypothetical protein PG987_016585 [Apiospora arundinis]